MSKENNEKEVSGVQSVSVIFTMLVVFFGTYEIVGPKEGFSLHQLITFIVAWNGAKFAGNLLESHFKNAKK